MATKSIIDVELNADAFTKFASLFKEYQDLLSKTPAAWQRVKKEVDATAAVTDTVVDSAEEVVKHVKDAGVAFHQNVVFMTQNNEINNSIAKAQEKSRDAVKHQSQSWHGMAKDSKDFASNVVNATKSLLHWSEVTAAISGLLGAGGLFGIDRLATSVAGQRKDASGIGVTPGDQKAFNLNFGRLFDNPNAVQTGIFESLHDVTKAAPYGALGLNYAQEQQRGAADASVDVLRALKTLADKTNENQLANVFSARQLSMLGITLEDFQRIKTRPLSEIEGNIGQEQRDRNSLNLSPGQLKAWEDFKVQLDRAEASIEKTFVTALTPLAPSLGRLSDSLGKVIDAFLRNPDTARWIDEASAGFDRLAKYIGTPEFDADVKAFVAGVGQMTQKIWEALKWLDLIPDDKKDAKPEPAPRPGLGPADKFLPEPGERPFWSLPPGTKPWMKPAAPEPYAAPGGFVPAAFRPSAGPSPVVTGNRVQEAHDFFRANGWNEEQTAGLLANLGTESGFKPDAFNPAGGGQGAQGIAQWRGDRIDNFRRMFGHDPRQGTFEEQLKFVQWELGHTERAAAERLRAARTRHDAGVAVNEAYERSGTHGSRGAEQYGQRFKDRSVQVHINNNTGGNANVTVAQLAT